MKNYRHKFIFIFLIVLGTISYGFINKKLIKSTSNLLNPEQEILGDWILENDPSTKISFTSDGFLYTYEDGILQNTDTYTITNECNGVTNSNGNLFLKTIDIEDNTEYCDLINGINENNSNFLSLMSDNGKIIIYVRP